jgi:hypothetical protein
MTYRKNSTSGGPPPDLPLWWRTIRIGVYSTGWAVAFPLPVNPWRRVTVGFLLAATAAYAVGIETASVVSISSPTLRAPPTAARRKTSVIEHFGPWGSFIAVMAYLEW